MLHIRLLTPQDDLPAVAQLYADSWKCAYAGILPGRFLEKLAPERWLSVLRAEPDTSLAAFEDGRIVGTAMLSYQRSEIVSLYLLPQETGRGIGAQLLAYALNALKENGCEQALVWVHAANRRAISFYQREGFRATGQKMQESYGEAACELIQLVRLL